MSGWDAMCFTQIISCHPCSIPTEHAFVYSHLRMGNWAAKLSHVFKITRLGKWQSKDLNPSISGYQPKETEVKRTFPDSRSFLHRQLLQGRIQQDLYRKITVTHPWRGKTSVRFLLPLCSQVFGVGVWVRVSLDRAPDTRSSTAIRGGVGSADWSPTLVASALGTEIDFLHFRVSSHLSFWLRSNVAPV